MKWLLVAIGLLLIAICFELSNIAYQIGSTDAWNTGTHTLSYCYRLVATVIVIGSFGACLAETWYGKKNF